MIENELGKHGPYSDFNFTSLWSWNTDNLLISSLNNNIILVLHDYIKDERTFTFLGSNSINETLTTLFEYMQTNGLQRIIKLIPETLIDKIDEDKFHIVEDPDSHDYILSVDKMMDYGGNKLGAKRNFVNRFKKNYNWSVELLDFNTDKDALHQTFHIWSSNKNDSLINSKEYKAFSTLIEHIDSFELIGVGLYVDNLLAGFAIIELTHNEHVIIHFEKADSVKYVGIYPFLMQKIAEIANQSGCKYINYEQDLGIYGLKKAKRSYAPDNFLKKYIIIPK